MSCEGCLTSNKGQDEEFLKIKGEAKNYAIQTEKAMAIYREGYEWKYISAEYALANGYQVRDIVSQYLGSAIM